MTFFDASYITCTVHTLRKPSWRLESVVNLNLTSPEVGENHKTSVTFFRYVSRFLDIKISWSVLILGLMEFIDLWKHNNYTIYSNTIQYASFGYTGPAEYCSPASAGLVQSVERLTAKWEVACTIPWARPILRVFNNWEMKVLPLPCKWIDLRVARITS